MPGATTLRCHRSMPRATVLRPRPCTSAIVSNCQQSRQQFSEIVSTIISNCQQSVLDTRESVLDRRPRRARDAPLRVKRPMRIPFSRFLPRSSAPGGLNVIRKEAWLLCRTSSGIRLCWEIEERKAPKGRHARQTSRRPACEPLISHRLARGTWTRV